MDRRQYLCSLALGSSSIVAGCSSSTESESTPTATASPTETEIETPTPTPTPEPPETETTEEPLSIQHLHGITGQTYPPDIEGNHSRRYEWSALGSDWWYENEFPRALGRYYKSRYGQNRNYDMYVTDAYGADYIRNLASVFEGFREDYDLSEREMVDLSVAFVQSLQYTKDDVNTPFDQYTSYPVETLIDRGGDCEDSTVLLAAILRELGFGCVLLGLWDAEPAHMALGVKGDSSVSGVYYEDNDERYYFVETTGKGWQIGDIPESYQDVRAEIIYIAQHPTLIYEYETSFEQEDNSLTLDVWIGNAGQVTAEGYSFIAEFEDRNGKIQAENRVRIEPLSTEEEMTDSLMFQPPEDMTLRLNTILSAGGTIQDFNRSEWQEPI